MRTDSFWFIFDLVRSYLIQRLFSDVCPPWSHSRDLSFAIMLVGSSPASLACPDRPNTPRPLTCLAFGGYAASSASDTAPDRPETVKSMDARSWPSTPDLGLQIMVRVVC
jgi:hypothetical protein